MIVWFVVTAMVVLIGLLVWWSAGRPPRGPADELAEKFRKSGGWGGL